MTRLSNTETLYDERDAAAFLGVSIYLLQRWRCYGGGPAFIRVGGTHGRAIRYRKSDLEAYIASNTVTSTGESV